MSYLLYFDYSKKTGPAQFSPNDINNIRMEIVAFKSEVDLNFYLMGINFSNLSQRCDIYSMTVDQDFPSYYDKNIVDSGIVDPKILNSKLFITSKNLSAEFSDALKMLRKKSAQLLENNLLSEAKKYAHEGINCYGKLGLEFGDINNLADAHLKAVTNISYDHAITDFEKNQQLKIINTAKQILSNPEAQEIFDKNYLAEHSNKLHQNYRP